MVRAVEYVRRMRGGAQSHLFRCDDGAYYVVKFQNNPQHLRVLANEMLGSLLARRLGLPAPKTSVVEVSAELVANTADLVIQLGAGRIPCKPGRQFGSQFPAHPAEVTAYDFLPDDQLAEVENLDAFAGMLVFDKWTCNTNGRQAVFLREPGQSHFRAMMIDQGFCFNAGDWNFPDAPLRGLYVRQKVYAQVRGLDSFEPFLERTEKRMTREVLGEAAEQIPPEWYHSDIDALEELLEKLYQRRGRIRELIVSARDSSRQPFPNWK